MKKLYLTTALALLTSPALADITPEALWQSWQETSSRFGMGLTASAQSREGAVLVLRDISATVDFGFFQIKQVFSQMRLEAMGDGTVSVNYDTSVTATLSIDIPDTPTPDVTITGEFAGTEGLVTGSADDYIYDFSIGRMEMVGTALMGETDGVQSSSISNARSSGISGRMHYTSSEAGINLDSSFTIESVNNTQESTNTIGGKEGGFKQSQRTLAEGYSGALSLFMPAANPESSSGSLIPEGFTMNADLAVEHMNVTQKTASPWFNMDIEIDQNAMGMALSIDEQNIAFSTSGQAAFASLAMPELGPQPYRTDLENTAFAMSIPFRPSDAPQESSLALRLGGVTVSDNIWALADPENTLSHAPADFDIAAKFSSTLLLDWTNIEAVKAWEGAPLLLHQVSLDTFLIALENAKLEGDGVVEFNSENDVPMPNGGALSFTFTGIPALLEKLGGLPLVDPAIIAQANGVLGIFTRAGEGETLVSDIEFGAEGQVHVNGQRVK